MNGDALDYDSKELTDAELLTQFAAGDEAAFREIVDRYKNGLHAFLLNWVSTCMFGDNRPTVGSGSMPHAKLQKKMVQVCQ